MKVFSLATEPDRGLGAHQWYNEKPMVSFGGDRYEDFIPRGIMAAPSRCEESSSPQSGILSGTADRALVLVESLD